MYRRRSRSCQHRLTLANGAEEAQQHPLRRRHVWQRRFGTGAVQADVMQLVRDRVLQLRGGFNRVDVEKHRRRRVTSRKQETIRAWFDLEIESGPDRCASRQVFQRSASGYGHIEACEWWQRAIERGRSLQ